MFDVLSQVLEVICSIFLFGIMIGGLIVIIVNIVIWVKEENEE